MTTTDVLVLIPVIPGMPVLATWWLPWEKWLPKYVPKKVLGPYILYADFAAWYFGIPWWAILIGVFWGVGLSVAAIIEAIDRHVEHSNYSAQ